MRTRCIYCDKRFDYRNDLIDMYVSDDDLCTGCRNELVIERDKRCLEGMEVRSFYRYDGLIKDLLLQYKECFDEALKDVFFYAVKDEIRIRYHGYTLIPCPSSARKREKRGFDHLIKMCECLKMPVLDCLYMEKDMSQVNKDSVERRKMIGNIRVREGTILPLKILLVDDVITTGSTLSGAYKALKRKQVKAMTLCFVNKDDHKGRFKL